MRIDVANSQIASAITQTPTNPSVAPQQGGSDFGSMLMDAIHEVNGSQAEARELQNAMMAGRPVELHDVMIAMEKAGTSMALTMQIRNKLLEAYQEISRMQV
ncbi:MAG: flagellar hook-basal body complex protein FliE [Fimbriimonadaceae bacterium]|nr:flagellar hook-basal body complex protein FliE [Fimbriimonadaceae bacterium]